MSGGSATVGTSVTSPGPLISREPVSGVGQALGLSGRIAGTGVQVGEGKALAGERGPDDRGAPCERDRIIKGQLGAGSGVIGAGGFDALG